MDLRHGVKATGIKLIFSIRTTIRLTLCAISSILKLPVNFALIGSDVVVTVVVAVIMVLTNVDGIGAYEMISLVVDF